MRQGVEPQRLKISHRRTSGPRILQRGWKSIVGEAPSRFSLPRTHDTPRIGSDSTYRQAYWRFYLKYSSIHPDYKPYTAIQNNNPPAIIQLSSEAPLVAGTCVILNSRNCATDASTVCNRVLDCNQRSSHEFPLEKLIQGTASPARGSRSTITQVPPSLQIRPETPDRTIRAL